MLDAVVFGNIQSLDFYEVRMNVVRIPEVSAKIFEAQEIWDKLESRHFNIYNFLVSENDVFQGNIKLKGLATAIVQLGLYERYCKRFGAPSFILGASNCDSPLKVAVGNESLESLIAKSSAREVIRPAAPLSLAGTPVLSGISLSEYAIYSIDGGKSECLSEGTKDFDELLTRAIDKEGVKKFVQVGPGNHIMNTGKTDYSLSDIQVLESIDIDPMLNWFWREVQMNPEPMQMLA